MNKKNLSVVMAGAMLATSVAPVLADTTASEIGLSQKALLKNTIKNKMAEKYLTTNKALKNATENKLLSNEVAALLTTNKDASAYGVKVLDKDGKTVNLYDTQFDNTGDGEPDGSTHVAAKSGATEIYTVTELENLFKSKLISKDYTLQIVERYTTEFMGQLIPGTEITAKTAPTKYTGAEITGINGSDDVTKSLKPDTTEIGTAGVLVNAVAKDKKSDTSATEDVIKVTLNKLTDMNDDSSNQVIELTTENNKLDGRLPLDKDGNLLDVTEKSDIQKFDHFAELVTYNVSQTVETPSKVVEAYKLVDDGKDDTKENYEASDLYDGFALTAKGTELLADLKNAAAKAEEKIGVSSTKNLVQLQTGAPSEIGSTGIYSFTITYYNSTKDISPSNPAKVVTVRSTNKTEITSLYNMLKDGSFSVGIVGGDNRYETAVNVAKENDTELSTAKNTSYNAHIVLVNGESLVDGLAAAPLAASVNKKDTNGTTSEKSAPVLLTAADKLSSATKDYITELTNEIAPADRDTITIDLVGGESVLTPELESELKGMGFNVERYGGDNREETSLEVAEAIVKAGAANDVFVVGGNGEADAMSIAPVASDKDDVTPIIVSSVHGLTKDAVKFIEKNSKSGSVTIVGGESVVSKEEAQKIDDVITNKVVRLDGANRFETNAKVIETYYKKGKSATGVVLVKDGQANKSELVDALSAANYAASMDAPIVLASSSLKDVQKNALLNVNGTVSKVAQVGVGAERTVLETIAKLFNVSNI